MADYINKNIILQSYVHINRNLQSLSEEELKRITDDLNSFAQARLKFFFKSDLQLDVKVEDGSIISRITVFGTILALHQFFVDYKDFREGVIACAQDVKMIAEAINLESMFSYGARRSDIIRLESRIGIIGSLQGIVGGIDAVSLYSGDIDSFDVIIKKMERIEERLQILEGNIRDPEDYKFIISELYQLIQTIPEVPRSPDKGSHPKYKIDMYSQSRKRIVNFVSSKIVLSN